MQNNQQQLAIIAIVAALAVLGVVAITIVTIPLQEAEARGCESGFPSSFKAFNASLGRCFGH
jgi:hypothetical protein